MKLLRGALPYGYGNPNQGAVDSGNVSARSSCSSLFRLPQVTDRLIRTIFPLVLLYHAFALAAVEDNVVLALDPREGLAVVQTVSGDLQVIGVGDVFPGSEVIVTQVLPDKVVAQEIVGGDRQVTQQVWIYKARNAETKSRVERLLLTVPRQDSQTPAYIDQRVIRISPDSAGAGQ